jgi:hypothetical protein
MGIASKGYDKGPTVLETYRKSIQEVTLAGGSFIRSLLGDILVAGRLESFPGLQKFSYR